MIGCMQRGTYSSSTEGDPCINTENSVSGRERGHHFDLFPTSPASYVPPWEEDWTRRRVMAVVRNNEPIERTPTPFVVKNPPAYADTRSDTHHYVVPSQIPGSVHLSVSQQRSRPDTELRMLH